MSILSSDARSAFSSLLAKYLDALMLWRKAESVRGCTGNLGVYVFILSKARTGKCMPRSRAAGVRREKDDELDHVLLATPRWLTTAP